MVGSQGKSQVTIDRLSDRGPVGMERIMMETAVEVSQTIMRRRKRMRHFSLI